jgi:hypothetical protein
MNLEIYSPMIECDTVSALSGKHSEQVPHTAAQFREIPVLREWLADDDLQQIQIVSANIGFVRTFKKAFNLGRKG